jgi:NTP pyrophosphatase (non-canonical NTP hydrolase)
MKTQLTNLDFADLRRANVTRNNAVFEGETWSATDWATAMAGECGEACNFIKKRRRGDKVSLKAIGKELADMITYADLLAHHLGIDLGEAVRSKFNEVSARKGAPIYL